MNLHEYQAKELLARYGIAAPEGRVASSPDEAEAMARKLPGQRFAVKAQVHAGGRGEAGGVRIVEGARAVRDVARELMGRKLVTSNTGPEGRVVRKVYVETAVKPERVLYLAALVDRTTGSVSLIGAREGGGDIEDRVARNPRIIEKLSISRDVSSNKDELRAYAARLGLTGPVTGRAVEVLTGLIEALYQLDASLIEINPLALMPDGSLLALDLKMVIDDNALFRHPELEPMRDEDEHDQVELQAQRHEINYVKLDGDIGVVVNGAGLALATLDLLRDAGGRPANFMDIRTMATSVQIARGLDILMADPRVKVILVNIHGGGLTRCDTVAEGIGMAFRRSGRALPLIFRAAGNNADFSRTVLRNCGVVYTDAQGMADAAERAVAITRNKAA
jgi:succinyl-CoA synthetase beta subunit